MANTKRKRAVVLALIAFFCGATAVVNVDWKRFGGGFLAFLKPKGDPVMAAAAGGAPAGGAILTALADTQPAPRPQLQQAAPPLHRHASRVGGGSGGHEPEEDLFKYGDPAAGGIPAGSFVVAQNDAPGAGPAPLPDTAAATETAVGGSSGGGEGGGVTSSAPTPNIGFGGGGGGVVVTTPAPPPSNGTPPAQPPATTPSAPPPPTQSGTSDQDPGNGKGSGDPVVTPPTPPSPASPPSSPVPPVSAVPEASNAAMMGLGALFIAVAATRRRKSGQA